MALMWKLVQVAEQTFRRLNAPELLPADNAGRPFVNWNHEGPCHPTGGRRLISFIHPLTKRHIWLR